MQNFRTDLALEAHELWKQSAGEESALRGVIAREELCGEMHIHRVEITDAAGAQALGKPIGRYSSVTMKRLPHRTDDTFSSAVETVSKELSSLLPDASGCVLVAGLGNEAITPDAVGGETVKQILVTRHLIREVPEYFSAMRSVAAVTPGVLGTTGVESREMIRAVANEINPACIIVVDALASHDASHLCKTIQISDAGLVPGSGVGNSRAAINSETMGIPVLAIGVPTVTDGEAGLMVTPKEIDHQVVDLGRILGYAINRALQPELTSEDLDYFLL